MILFLKSLNNIVVIEQRSPHRPSGPFMHGFVARPNMSDWLGISPCSIFALPDRPVLCLLYFLFLPDYSVEVHRQTSPLHHANAGASLIGYVTSAVCLNHRRQP